MGGSASQFARSTGSTTLSRFVGPFAVRRFAIWREDTQNSEPVKFFFCPKRALRSSRESQSRKTTVRLPPPGESRRRQNPTAIARKNQARRMPLPVESRISQPELLTTDYTDPRLGQGRRSGRAYCLPTSTLTSALSHRMGEGGRRPGEGWCDASSVPTRVGVRFSSRRRLRRNMSRCHCLFLFRAFRGYPHSRF